MADQAFEQPRRGELRVLPPIAEEHSTGLTRADLGHISSPRLVQYGALYAGLTRSGATAAPDETPPPVPLASERRSFTSACCQRVNRCSPFRPCADLVPFLNLYARLRPLRVLLRHQAFHSFSQRPAPPPARSTGQQRRGRGTAHA